MQLDTEQDPDGGWYDRFVRLVDEEGHVVEEFGKNPTLDELREAERNHGIRLNLWRQGLVCSDCGNQINDRFSADFGGNLLCWDCAMEQRAQERGNLSQNSDPTKTVLSQSKLYEKSLCDYVINVATGCRHGCKFCYVPSTPAVDSREEMLAEKADVRDVQRDWGNYLLYRDDLPERLHEGLEDNPWDEWEKTDRGRGVVMLSSGTDCYQDRRAAQITRGCVQELVEHGVPVRILTRSPNVTRDIDLFKEYSDLITVGMSIPSFDTSLVRVIEPNAPPPMARWEALDQMYRNSIRHFVSFSPTYPTMEREDLYDALNWFRALDPEVVFHEPINPRGSNFEMLVEAVEDAGYEAASEEFERLRDEDEWVEYSLEHIEMVHELAQSFGDITVHTWPDRALINATRGEIQRQLREMQQTISYESLVAPGSRQSPLRR